MGVESIRDSPKRKKCKLTKCKLPLDPALSERIATLLRRRSLFHPVRRHPFYVLDLTARGGLQQPKAHSLSAIKTLELG